MAYFLDTPCVMSLGFDLITYACSLMQ